VLASPDGRIHDKSYAFDPIPATLPTNFHHKILGPGCQMWGEWIPTVQIMNHKVYSSIAAHAETNLTEKSKKDWNRLRNKFGKHLKPKWSKKRIRILPEQE